MIKSPGVFWLKGRRKNTDTASASGRLLICLPSAQPSLAHNTFLSCRGSQQAENLSEAVNFKFGF
jgi:hypothetical protein